MPKSVAGLEYSNPRVLLLQESGLGVAEIAARTCYDSFDASENEAVKRFDTLDDPNEFVLRDTKVAVNDIKSSDLLMSLAWVHHHHSILEHINLSFHIQGTSRGVLQEFARHRIQAISVRSTRYTMSGVINAFVASIGALQPRQWFIKTCVKFDMLVTTSESYNAIELGTIWDKLHYQKMCMPLDEFINLAVAKSSTGLIHRENYTNLTGFTKEDRIFDALQAGKKKRNVGDAFKHIVTDNWKVDLVSTMNLRALKNFLTLRDSGAAYFAIRQAAQAMKVAMPAKYKDLIIK